MFFEAQDIQFALRLFAALTFGSVIGLERQWRQRMAGMRTNMLVAAGSASFVMLSQAIPNGGDETHVLAYVVSGVGFLGAGVIMKDGLSITGLNTAATLWCSAAVGAITGFGFGFRAATLMSAVLITNTLLRPVAKRVSRRATNGTPGASECDLATNLQHVVGHER